MEKKNGASKLRRTETPSVYEKELTIDWGISISDLIGHSFFDLLEDGHWWGCCEAQGVGEQTEAILLAMAKQAIRGACVGARAGVAGYWAVLMHPCDAMNLACREISPARGQGRKLKVDDKFVYFVRLTKSDFPKSPQIFATNEMMANSAVLANQEKRALESMASMPESDSAKSRRL